MTRVRWPDGMTRREHVVAVFKITAATVVLFTALLAVAFALDLVYFLAGATTAWFAADVVAAAYNRWWGR